MHENIKVGMADYKAICHPGILVTLGLGSCVGIALYDPTTRIIGLAHIMLPTSKISKSVINEAKFADTAIVRLVEEMVKLGANRRMIKAKLAGGAQMFNFNDFNDNIRIGLRNIEASREVLAQLDIPIVSEDVGGSHGRTIELYSDDGKLLIKTVGFGINYI
ncbi:MAG TPA: chemotaxis protein CheD [Pseudobacteroides sp.]|nr:chemotaxis protein CheD [Pseudobacteroides sp.]